MTEMNVRNSAPGLAKEIEQQLVARWRPAQSCMVGAAFHLDEYTSSGRSDKVLHVGMINAFYEHLTHFLRSEEPTKPIVIQRFICGHFEAVEREPLLAGGRMQMQAIVCQITFA